MDLSLRIKQKLERNDNNPSSPTGQDVRTENFSEQFRQVRELQRHNQVAAKAENDRKKEIVRQRNLDHCRTVNHQRLIKSSDELRTLFAATQQIEAQQANLAYIQKNERKKINARLKELEYGAAYRAMDSADANGQAAKNAIKRQSQEELRQIYEKQLAEQDHKKYLQFLELEEERKFVNAVVKDEEKKRVEARQQQLLEKQHWRSAINDFKEERKMSEHAKAESLRKEEERIAADANRPKVRADLQKEQRLQRERVAEALRQQLVQKLTEKENQDKEHARIQEELWQAENEESYQAKKRLEFAKKVHERDELRAGMKDIAMQKQQSEVVRRKEWNEYLELLKGQAEDYKHQELLKAEWRKKHNADVKADWDIMMNEKGHRKINGCKEDFEQQNKETHNIKFWKQFVDLERETFLRSKVPQLKDFVAGYQRFPLKKDSKLMQQIIEENNNCNSNMLQHPLAGVSPQEKKYGAYQNMLDARISEIYGIGSK